MRNLTEWFIEKLRGRYELRLRGRILSGPELDAIADTYGFPLHASLRALLRAAAEYGLPVVSGVTLRLRPEREVLSAEPTPFGPLQWFPLALRFSGFYPIGTNEKREVFAVSLLAPVDEVYRWSPTGEVCWVAPSLEAFWVSLLDGKPATETREASFSAKFAARFSWIEAFLGRHYTTAARLFIERRPERPASASLCVASPASALYWLLDSLLLGDAPLAHEILQLLGKELPLLRTLASYFEDQSKLSLQHDIQEGRAQLEYELARIDTSLSPERRQALLLRAVTPGASLARILGILSLSSEPVAKQIALLLEQFSVDVEPSRSHEWLALSTLALAYAKEKDATITRADLLAWGWRQDPWYGTRPGEAERLSHLVSAYALVGCYDRAEALLTYVQEKAPGAGAALAARVDFLLQSDRSEEAINALELALQQLPTDPHLHASRARLEAKGLSISWVDPAWPPALKSLAEEALRGDAATRISALERLRQLLVSRVDPPALPFLLTIIQTDPAGRAGALRALAQCPFAASIPVLVEWAKREDDPLHARLALAALRKNTSDEAREALAELGKELPERLAPKPETPPPDVESLDRKLREGDRETALQVAQIAANNAAWTQQASLREDLQSLRALAMAKSGMFRDATELADVLAWGWRQDPLCGERPGEAERFARLIDTYRVANRLDRAKPLLAFLRQKSSSDAPLAVEIDLALDAGQEEQAQTLLWEGLSRYPGSRWLHSCRVRLGKRATEVSLVDPSWPPSIRDALSKILNPTLSERVSALEALTVALLSRKHGQPAPLEVPFVLSLAYHDEPLAAHAAFVAICAHPFPSAKPLLRAKVESPDPDVAAMAVRALSSLGEIAVEDFVSFLQGKLYHKVPSLLVVLSENTTHHPLLREALLQAIKREGLEGAWLGPWLLRAFAPFARPEDVGWVSPFLSNAHPITVREAALAVLVAAGADHSVWVEPLLTPPLPLPLPGAARRPSPSGEGT